MRVLFIAQATLKFSDLPAQPSTGTIGLCPCLPPAMSKVPFYYQKMDTPEQRHENQLLVCGALWRSLDGEWGAGGTTLLPVPTTLPLQHSAIDPAPAG